MIIRALILTGAALALIQSANALEIKDIPNPRQQNGGWIADTAKVLTIEQETQLNRQISSLESKNGSEIAVVTIPKSHPNSPKELATELFNNWGIGKKGKDNGVLILVAVGDRRVEIETGYGVEGVLPDSKVGRIISTDMIPLFKKGDYGSGIVAGTSAIAIALSSDSFNSSAAEAQSNTLAIVSIAALLSIGSAIFFICRYRRPRRYIMPEAESRLDSWDGEYRCSECRGRMEKVEGIAPYLTSPQLVAQKVGSTVYQGWKCPKCSGDGLHLMSDKVYSSKYVKCPRCKELTASRQESIVSGKKLIVEACQCDFCDYHLQKEEEIPVRRNPNSSYGKQVGKTVRSSETEQPGNRQTSDSKGSNRDRADNNAIWGDTSSSWSNSSDTSSSWSSSSDTTSSWSSSDFGGGSSGGGGAGDSW